jgi:hypothetical protein
MRKLLFLLILLPCFVAEAQQTPTINIDLSREKFSDKLPFDIKFKVAGTLSSKKAGALINLKVIPSDQSRVNNYFRNGFQDTEVNFESEKDGVFTSCPIGPIRPNISYKFRFFIRTPITIDPNDQEFINMKGEIIQIFSQTMGFIKTSQEIEALNNLVTKKFVSFLSKQERKILHEDEITTIDGKKLSLKVFGNLNLDNLRVAKKNVKDAEGEIRGTIEDYVKAYDAVKDKAKKIAEKLDKNSPFENDLISILSAVDEFAKFVVKQENDKLLDIKTQFISIFHKKIKDDPELDDKAKELVEGIIIPKLQQIHDQNEIITTETNKVLLLESKLNTFLQRDLFINEVFFTDDFADIDVTSEKTPYISLDMGFNLRPWGTLTQFLIYQGANIYFSPIDKRAPLEYFRFGHAIRKIISLNIGVAQPFGAVRNTDFKGSIDDKMHFLLGGGVRLNRIFKLNFNYIFYKINDKNPIVDRPRIKAYPYFGFSIDTDVIGALSTVGSAIGLVKK